MELSDDQLEGANRRSLPMAAATKNDVVQFLDVRHARLNSCWNWRCTVDSAQFHGDEIKFAKQWII